jgi:hypothetical protein
MLHIVNFKAPFPIDNMTFWGVRCKDDDWLYLAQERDKLRDFASMAMKLGDNFYAVRL